MDLKIINQLKNEYPDNKADIELLAHYLDTVEEHITLDQIAEKIEKAQQIVNRLYTLHESDVIIEVQVLINELRYKFDITDPREIINYDNGKGFVQ